MDIGGVLAHYFPWPHEWTVTGDSYADIEWHSDTPKPTEEELEALADALEDLQAMAVARELRRQAFVMESDPIKFKVMRGEASHEDWLAAVAAIRDRYPYPTD